MTYAAQGFVTFAADPRVLRWAHAARTMAQAISADPAWRGPDNLRHGQTWFVGVDALPNAPDGSVGGVPLVGAWQAMVPDLPLHRAQLSIIYPGYPRADPSESASAHRFRRVRMAAHVDGLIPTGPQKRRFAQEFHAYILALPLTQVQAAPTVVWPGSHLILQAALRRAIGDRPAADVDVTEAYQSARRTVLDKIAPVPLSLRMGEAALLHRFVLHGTAPWAEGVQDPDGQGRVIAFFRPECAGGAGQWLAPD